jgi:hypothetical protein
MCQCEFANVFAHDFCRLFLEEIPDRILDKWKAFYLMWLRVAKYFRNCFFNPHLLHLHFPAAFINSMATVLSNLQSKRIETHTTNPSVGQDSFSTQRMFTRRVDFLIMSSVNIFDLCLLISMPTSLIPSIAGKAKN